MFSTKILLAASILTVCVSSVSADPQDLDLDNDSGEWRVVVDGVMGGRSTGSVTREEIGLLVFSGALSLDNNGGFSQMRYDVDGDQFAGMRGIEITVRGDGRKYNFDIRCSNARVMAGGFQQAFETRKGEWTTIRMPFDDFRLYTFGRSVPRAPSLVPALIESVGFTLSDKIEGPFRLEIASIRAYGKQSDGVNGAKPDLSTLTRSSTLQRLIRLTQADDQDRAIQAESDTAGTAAMRLTELAIKRGVPLFNNGEPAACAAIYEVAIEALVALGTEDLGSSIVERLEHGLADAKADSNPSERAWTYRRALDDAYGRLERRAQHATPAAGR